MSQLEFTDNLVKEYLLFRGLSSTIKQFEQEKGKISRSEKILENITQAINNTDLQSLLEIWTQLDQTLFKKLEYSFVQAIKKLENGLLKLYLVNAYSAGRQDKIHDFFTKLSHELLGQNDWKDWFYFPFCKYPEDYPAFVLYFSRQWQDTLYISIRNFLSTILQCLPQPTLLMAEQETNSISKLSEEVANLKLQIQDMSRLQSHHDAALNSSLVFKRNRPFRTNVKIQTLNEIIPFDVYPSSHVVDDFYIIATETTISSNSNQYADVQAKGLKLLIKNIGSNSSLVGSSNTNTVHALSPLMGRKELKDNSSKRRSGSAGRYWN